MWILKKIVDVVFMVPLWVYYLIGFPLVFLPCYVVVYLFSREKETHFQRLNTCFHRIFFRLMSAVNPGLQIEIPEEVRNIRSSVIIANHISYLDPLLLVSIFKCHKSIVKQTFFRVPLFGWILKNSGFIAPNIRNDSNESMEEWLNGLESYFADGGNLFVFPEGTRSRDGRVGNFEKGAFKIARKCGVPIALLFIRNTNKVFPIGGYLFRTCVRNTIKVERIARIEPERINSAATLNSLVENAKQLYFKIGS
ncbi:MAG: lysophospholipid acyltransferase family protein [Pseudomonadota bacterium]